MSTLQHPSRGQAAPAIAMLNKVPEATIFFWLIKIMATTIGETAADYLNVDLNLGLTNTTYVMGVGLVAILVVQFRARRYVPIVYWAAVVLISIVGTLITDNLTDRMGVPLPVSTGVFSVLLAATFGAWYASERTLSIHSIVTRRREAFYWSAILCTFALGTAAGDLVSEEWGLGYWRSGLLFGGLIGLIALAYRFGKLGPIAGFWMAYVLTRPLGASIGDFLSQTRADGGLGLGTTGTTVLFLAGIVTIVAYFTALQRRSPALAS
jgi:uncharacterized membrane-anchored protein